MTSPTLRTGVRTARQPTLDRGHLLVIVPAYNEAQNVADVIREVRRTVPVADLVVVDDASEDGTAEVCAQELVPVVRLPFNLGVGGAMRAGYLYAAEHGYEAAVQIDADGQHDPRFIAPMLDALEHHDVVVGARFAGIGEYAVSRQRRLAMHVVSRILSRVCGTRLTDATSGMRMADRRAIEVFARLYPAEYLGDTLQSLVIARRSGLSIMQVPVEMRPRSSGAPSQGICGSAVYLIRCLFALSVRKTSRHEERWLAHRVTP